MRNPGFWLGRPVTHSREVTAAAAAAGGWGRLAETHVVKWCFAGSRLRGADWWSVGPQPWRPVAPTPGRPGSWGDQAALALLPGVSGSPRCRRGTAAGLPACREAGGALPFNEIQKGNRAGCYPRFSFQVSAARLVPRALSVVRSAHITFVRITATLYFLGGKHRNINSKTETIIDPIVPTGFSIYLL